MKTRILTVGLLVFAVAFFIACGKNEKGSVATGDLDVKQFVNADCTGFFVVDFASVVDNKLLEEVVKDDEAKEGIKKFKEATGIDIEKDLKSAVVVLMGKLDKQEGNDFDGYFVLNGKFDKAKLTSMIKNAPKAQVENLSVLGQESFIVKPDSAEDEDVYLTFIDKALIVGVNKDGFQTGIKTCLGKARDLTVNTAMSEKYDNANKDHMFWGLINIPKDSESTKQMGMIPGMKEMETVYLGVSYASDTLEIDLNLFLPSTDSIKQVATALDGFMNMAKASTGEQPQIAELLDQIKISQESDSVRIYMSLTKEQLESLKDMGGMWGGPR